MEERGSEWRKGGGKKTKGVLLGGNGWQVEDGDGKVRKGLVSGGKGGHVE